MGSLSVLLLVLAAHGVAVKAADLEAVFRAADFAPVVDLPPKGQYTVRDFTGGPDGNGQVDLAALRPRTCGALGRVFRRKRCAKKPFDVGRYNEVRPGMYTTDIFAGGSAGVEGYDGVRNIHIGLDIGGPVGTPVMAPADGVIKHFGYNAEPGDYGHAIVTEHVLGNGTKFYMLFGHLSAESCGFKRVGQRVSRGEVIGWFGAEHENGGWPAHVHVQLSLVEPLTHDMPGVVSRAQLAQALRDYPDPRLVLGPIYDDEGEGKGEDVAEKEDEEAASQAAPATA